MSLYAPQTGGDAELPGYNDTSRSNGRLTEHTVTLEDSKSRTWVWLSVKSRANNPGQLPLYFEGDTIGGTVTIDFGLTSSVKIVSLKVRVLVRGVKSILSNDLVIAFWWCHHCGAGSPSIS